ncbi:MAG: hypothetical protein DMF95_27830, partial [Acidobacteria bacterium]
MGERELAEDILQDAFIKVMGGSFLLPWDLTLGVVWTGRSPLPWSATAGRDLNRDGFNSDLVPGTSRNSGSRDLNLTAERLAGAERARRRQRIADRHVAHQHRGRAPEQGVQVRRQEKRN